MKSGVIRGIVLLLCGVILVVFSVLTIPHSSIESTILLVSSMLGVGLVVVGVQWMSESGMDEEDKDKDP